MVTLFQTALMRLAVCGLVASLLLLTLRSRMARDAFARLCFIWRSLTALGRVAIGSFLLVGVLVGGDKTNSVNNLPPQMMSPLVQQGHASFLTGLPVNGNLINTMNLLQSQATGAERKSANWNVRGAWKDSFWLDFEDGWEFPWGTNHLSGVEVISCGQIWPMPFDTNAVATAGSPFEIVPGLTTFAYEFTPSNSCRFAWTDAAVNRDTNNLVSAALELFRCGDVAVTTNGVTRTIPRELPFAHDGFGQDAEWVAANFTSATEIAAAGGYPAWVDAQVGEGLTNGLYKFTVTMSDDPPETTLLSVGDLSVAVTNAGEYVFLLEKGVEYEYGTIPFLTNVVYSAVDDIPAVQLQPRLLSATGDGAGGWTVDGGCENQEPTAAAPGRVAWWPLLYGSPDVSHIGPDDSHVTFEAVLSDYCASGAVSYQWAASDGLAVASPNAQTTEVTVQQMPSWAEAYLSVTATLGSKTLYSYADRLTYGTNTTPQVHLSLDVPTVLIVRDEWMAGSESAMAHVNLSSDIETNGVLHAWLDYGEDKVLAALPESQGFYWSRSATLSFVVDGVRQSDVQGDVRMCCAFVGEDGTTNATASATTTVVSLKRVTVPSAPATGLCVLKNASVPVVLELEPTISVVTRWQTAKRKTRDCYDPWVQRGAGSPNTNLPMPEAGIFALRVITIGGGGCQSNAVEYAHAESEPYEAAIGDYQGPNKAGMRNHVGVANSQGLLNIRTVALSHLNQVEYGFDDWLMPRNGFSFVKSGRWKCNAFVADIAIAAGFPVPVMYMVPHNIGPDSQYPPSANDWASGATIQGWVFLGSNAYPEPGFIAGHPNPGGLGHCGIVDYDGWTISARRDGICRTATSMLDGTCGYSKPNEENNNEN